MTPEEFAQLQPGDDVIFIGNTNSFLTNGKSYRVVQKNTGTIGSISIVNDLGMLGSISDLNKISKVEEETRFEVGKQYISKNNNKLKATCIAISTENMPILKLTNSTILEINPEFNQNWKEYIPPVIHKRYIHWFKTHSKSNMFVYTSDNKLEYIFGCSVLHVQEVSFEEKRNA